ncbi:MAG: pilin [Patescibacteria group bacterium]
MVIKKIIIVLIVLALPLLVKAQSVDPGLQLTADAAGLPTGTTSPITVISIIVNSLLGVLGVVFLILIIYAGFLWMTAAGNEEKVTKAKGLIGNAVVGLAIVLASFIITSFIFTALKKSTLAPPATGSACSSQGGSCTSLILCAAPAVSLGNVGCPANQVCCQQP